MEESVEIDIWTVERNGIVTVTSTGKLAPLSDVNGYLAVRKDGKLYRIDELVAKGFLEGSGPVLKHIDNDNYNSHVDNLVWCKKPGKKIILKKGDEIMKFDSYLECSIHFNVNHKYLSNCISSGKLPSVMRDWEIV